tara:strand:- start:434 stop:808 length:375 start_codon:yes stop_codon:yes gene_type:complete
MFEFIFGLIQIGNSIGEPIKAGAELFDENGNLLDRQKAKNSAIIGGLFSPSKALKLRQESGCWYDLTGNCYADWLESNEKQRLKEVRAFDELERLRQEKIKLYMNYAYVFLAFIILLIIISYVL